MQGFPRLVVDLKIIGPTGDYDWRHRQGPTRPASSALEGQPNSATARLLGGRRRLRPGRGFLIPEDDELVDPDQTVLVKIGNRHNDRVTSTPR